MPGYKYGIQHEITDPILSPSDNDIDGNLVNFSIKHKYLL